MKKLIEKGKNYILLLFITLTAFIPKFIKADSGFDASYDSGGSFDAGGSWDSDYGSSGGGGDMDPETAASIFVGIGAIFAYFLLASKLFTKSKKEDLNIPKWYTGGFWALFLIAYYFFFNQGIFASYYTIVAFIVFMYVGFDKYTKPNKDVFYMRYILAFWTIFYITLYMLVEFDVFGVALFLGIVLFSFYLIALVAMKFSEIKENKEKYVMTEEEIKKELGQDFDVEAFYQEVFNDYKDIQIAWMERDVEPVRHLLADEMFNMYRTQLATLIAKNQKNMMEDITYVSCGINDIKNSLFKTEIIVFLDVTCRDYIINMNTNKVQRGNSHNINHYSYKLTFVRDKKETNLTKCPNCGAILDSSQSDKCEYCETVVLRDSINLRMTDKKMLKQYVKGHK